MSVELNGSALTIDDLVTLSRNPGIDVTLDNAGLVRVEQSYQTVLRAVKQHDPVYGLTTGLGSRVTESLSAEQMANFSAHILRGRAHSIGEPFDPATMRAVMIVRLNTLLRGAAGASSALVHFIAACIKRDLLPVVGRTGSIGASDLCLGATLGLALIGEGRIMDSKGNVLAATDALARAGLEPVRLVARDGLALANHSCFGAATMALAVSEASVLIDACQHAAAVSMAGFRANLSPLDPRILDLRPQAGQRRAAQQLRDILGGSDLLEAGNARRLQDPLSIRNVAQVHGAAFAALEFALAAASDEINGASDNPVVELDRRQILSGGGFCSPLLTIASQTLSQALVHLVHMQLARIACLLTERFTGLPQYLAGTVNQEDQGVNNGFAPVLKIAESLVAEVSHAAMPVQVWPSVNADGVEDIQTNSMTAISGLSGVVGHARALCAIELLVGVAAVEHRGGTVPGAVGRVVDMVRACSAALQTDRPLGADIETIAQRIAEGDLSIAAG